MLERINVCFQEAANGNTKSQKYLRRVVFLACIKNFFAQDGMIDGKNQLFVFKGFPKDFYFSLNNIYGKIKHFSGEWNGEYPFEVKKVNLLLKYFFTASGACWCFYEEFEALRRVLKGDFSVYEGKIIIVGNDIFGESEHTHGIRFFESIRRAAPDFDERVISEAQRITLDELNEITNNLLNGKLNHQNFCIDAAVENVMNLQSLNSLGYYYHVKFFAQKIQIHDDENKYLPLLQRYWGNDAQFRKQKYYSDPLHGNKAAEISQGRIISEIIAQSLSASSGKSYSDIIVTAPTGAGKSIFFQIPGIYFHENNGVTIIVTPLVALMADQVNELRKRGINFATFINSTITWDERNRRISDIQNGICSIVYFSPELLTASGDIRNIIGERKISLFVVDEAHLVTTWGREFRVDYIFLGDFIRGLRNEKNNNQRFPTLCLTATAVYGGVNDVIFELQDILKLQHSIIHLGYVCRENITFEIRQANENANKDELAIQAILNYAQNHTKAIIYFPYASQVKRLYDSITRQNPEIEIYQYYGNLENVGRDNAYNNFKDSNSAIMLATKAFGMGINIGDIESVYHYAPSGTLADYVQEIGRAARTLEEGFAVTDYRQNDMRFGNFLWNSNSLRHYQLHEMAKKLFSLYERKGKNFLVSSETFEYIFSDEKDGDRMANKVKRALLLLRDGTNAIQISPTRLQQYQYITVPPTIEENFRSTYGSYSVQMNDGDSQQIFKIDLVRLWEDQFGSMNFQDFKNNFFDGELFPFEFAQKDNIDKVIRIAINYNRNYDNVKTILLAQNGLASVIRSSFNQIRYHNPLHFAPFHFNDFEEIFREKYNTPISHDHIKMMFDLFCYDPNASEKLQSWKIVERSRSNEGEETIYMLRRFANHVFNTLTNYINNAIPNQNENSDCCVVYRQWQFAQGFLFFASLLQILGLASYEINGGKKDQLSLAITNPALLRQIAKGSFYQNQKLDDIEEGHQNAVCVMKQFFESNFENNSERWKFIENYFLGMNVSTPVSI